MVAAILAGGASRRMGGEPKAALVLEGRTLLAWAVDAASGAGLRPVVVAKAGMLLPAVDAERWDEPAEPRHPLTGLRAAVDRAGPEGCVALAVDTPFLPPALLRALAACGERTFVRSGGRVHPLPGRWLGPLPASGALLALGAAELEWPQAGDLLNVNAPDDLLAAERRLRPRREAE